jgi:hypothetical protein
LQFETIDFESPSCHLIWVSLFPFSQNVFFLENKKYFIKSKVTQNTKIQPIPWPEVYYQKENPVIYG